MKRFIIVVIQFMALSFSITASAAAGDFEREQKEIQNRNNLQRRMQADCYLATSMIQTAAQGRYLEQINDKSVANDRLTTYRRNLYKVTLTPSGQKKLEALQKSILDMVYSATSLKLELLTQPEMGQLCYNNPDEIVKWDPITP